MKIFLPVIFLLVSTLYADSPACEFHYTFSNRTRDVADAVSIFSPPTNGPTINNCGATGWQLQYSSEGFSGVSLTLETAQRTSPTGSLTWITFSGTDVIGSLPLTATTSSRYIGTGYFPLVRVNVTTATGTGSIDVILTGWKSNNFLASLGTVKVVNSGTLTSTALVTGGGGQSVQTPSATSTLDASGNMSIPGTFAALSYNGLTVTSSTGTLTVTNGVVLTGPEASGTAAALNQTNTFTSAAVVDLSAASTTAGLKLPSAAGAVPTADGFVATNTTNHTYTWGSNGTTEVGAVAATGTGTATTCTNQFVSAVSSLVAPTCTTATLASAQFANQGTTTTLLHGNGAGNPSFGAAVGGDFGSSIAARTVFGNNTASAAAPGFNTTSDALVYQTAEIPAYVFVTGDFTTSGSGTALEAITGLTWTMPGSLALNIPFSCHLIYHQNSAAVAVAFGTLNATTGPTNYAVKGTIYTSASVFAAANVVANTATTAVSVVSGTPSAITTNWNADLDGFIEQPSGTASVFTIRVSTATQGDTVTVKRGSFCRVG